jgi:hypothetical protein
MAKDRKKFLCLDCKVDTGLIGEHYFIHTDTWFEAHASKKGMLCVGCLEKRLNRRLSSKDFPAVYINSLQFGIKSERLLDRLRSK